MSRFPLALRHLETESVAAGEVILNQLLSVQRCLQLHIQASSKGCNTASAKGSNVAPNVGSNAPASKPPPPAAEPKPERPSKPPRREHPPPGPPPAPVYVCPQCHKSFPWLCYLKRHLRTHSGDTVYMCKDCGFRTRKYSEFTMHQRAHNWDRSYRKGDHDDPQPSRRGGQSHQHSHTAKRPSSNKPDFIQAHPHGFSKHFKGFVPQKRMYKCPKCDLMLDSKEDLVKHLNTVHNPKKSSSETSCESCMSRSDSSSGTVYRQETRCRQLIKPESAPLLCRTRLPPVPEVHPRMIRSRTVL